MGRFNCDVYYISLYYLTRNKIYRVYVWRWEMFWSDVCKVGLLCITVVNKKNRPSIVSFLKKKINKKLISYGIFFGVMYVVLVSWNNRSWFNLNIVNDQIQWLIVHLLLVVGEWIYIFPWCLLAHPCVLDRILPYCQQCNNE